MTRQPRDADEDEREEVPAPPPRPGPNRRTPARKRLTDNDPRTPLRRSAEKAAPAPQHDHQILDQRIPAQDERGFSRKWTVEVPVYFDAEVQAFLNSKEYDFASLREFVAWSTHFALDYLLRLDPAKYPSNFAIIKAVAAENRQLEMRRQFGESIEHTINEAVHLIGQGMTRPAVVHVSRVLAMVRGMAPDDPYRKLYEDAIKARCGQVLKLGEISDLRRLDWSRAGEGEEQ